VCDQDRVDLVQDVVVRVMAKLSTFAGEGDRCFVAWLRTVMLNRWRDLGRRKAARPSLNDPGVIEVAVQRNEREHLTDTDDCNFIVRRALQVMKSDFEETTWRACWMRVAQSRSAADVARELGVSEDVVYTSTYKVIRWLRSELAGLWE
jgi:RNA polymerase sigma-70 factor (ECF subfamily)